MRYRWILFVSFNCCFVPFELIVIVGTNNDNLELYAIVLDVEAGVPAFYLILEMKRAICEAAVMS